MQDLVGKFERIFIDRCSENSRLAARVREIFPSDRISVCEGRPLPESQGALSARQFDRSKRLLYLTEFKGRFFKRCPGARPGLACCNYFVLNWGLQCDMNCSYCYLQSFINTPTLTLYTNLDDALEELRGMTGMTDQPVRVGTGETVDSLSLDKLTLFSHELISFFRAYPKWTLEFKTKSDKVDQFLDVEHGGNVIVSWSVNPQNIVEREEHGTASLEARLAAARKCADRGFQISFHIDPMIWHPGWQESYANLVDAITARFTPAQVPVMSVGALRFQPEQKAMMRERFGMNSYVTTAETFIGRDGKQRYDAHLRQEMFRLVMDRFKAHNPNWRIFMCMETPETWLKTEGALPFKSETLKDLFKTIKPPVGELRTQGAGRPPGSQ
jgi:spore photoproduct lyase